MGQAEDTGKHMAEETRVEVGTCALVTYGFAQLEKTTSDRLPFLQVREQLCVKIYKSVRGMEGDGEGPHFDSNADATMMKDWSKTF